MAAPGAPRSLVLSLRAVKVWECRCRALPLLPRPATEVAQKPPWSMPIPTPPLPPNPSPGQLGLPARIRPKRGLRHPGYSQLLPEKKNNRPGAPHGGFCVPKHPAGGESIWGKNLVGEGQDDES